MSEEISKKPIDINIDLSYLNEVASGSVEFMIEMIDIFLEQTPVYFTQLTEAVNAGDWKTTGDTAHKIKPTLAFMGLVSAKNVLQEIESNARNLVSVETIKEDLERVISVTTELYARLEEQKQDLQKKL
jgi:HPt (histidine-containing phosphotransfer) domain-containing protein